MILVGHSYGGVVITEAGNDPKVESLAYIAAFAPDEGESVETPDRQPAARRARCRRSCRRRTASCCSTAASSRPPSRPTSSPGRAQFMADSQVPWGVEALAGKVTEPGVEVEAELLPRRADDHMIPPPAQRLMAERAGAEVVETPGSHAVYVSRPEAVAALIEQAERREFQGPKSP